LFGNGVEKVTVALLGFPVNDVFATLPDFVVNPPDPAFKANDAVKANDELVAIEAVEANDELTAFST
jgi:hypothetical protein